MLAIPLRDLKHSVVQPLSGAFSLCAGPGTFGRRPRDDGDVGDDEYVILMKSAARLTGYELALGGAIGMSSLVVATARDVEPLQLDFLVEVPRGELVHEQGRVGLRHGRVYICRSQKKCGSGVGIGDVDEKNTDAVTTSAQSRCRPSDRPA